MPETSESAGSPQQERPSGSERHRPLRVLLAGGGGMNGSLLAAGCIDELSLVVASVAEGDPKAVSLFAASPFAPDFAGAAFRLVEAKPWEGDALWLHYRAE